MAASTCNRPRQRDALLNAGGDISREEPPGLAYWAIAAREWPNSSDDIAVIVLQWRGKQGC
jgi:hypothetical protein